MLLPPPYCFSIYPEELKALHNLRIITDPKIWDFAQDQFSNWNAGLQPEPWQTTSFIHVATKNKSLELVITI